MLESNSKEEAIKTLSIMASEKVMQGNFEVSLVRLEKLTKKSLGPNLKSELVNLAAIRNKIIHEAAEPEVSVGDVRRYFDLMYSLLKYLGETGIQCGVKLNDPTNLVT